METKTIRVTLVLDVALVVPARLSYACVALVVNDLIAAAVAVVEGTNV